MFGEGRRRGIDVIGGYLTEINVTSPTGVREVKRFGGPDIAFNNACIAQGFTPLPAIDSDLAQRIVDIDLMGVFYAMKHQIPAMLERARATGRGCAILNTSSLQLIYNGDTPCQKSSITFLVRYTGNLP